MFTMPMMFTPVVDETVPPTTNLTTYYTMSNYSAPTLTDEQGNYNATVTGAVQTSYLGGQGFDFSDNSHNIEVAAGMMSGIPSDGDWTIVMICNPEDNVDGCLFEYDWASPAAGSIILINEPGSSQMRFFYRNSLNNATAVQYNSALPSATDCCVIFGYDSTASNIFLEVNGTEQTNSHGGNVRPGGGGAVAAKIGNRSSSLADFGGVIGAFAFYEKVLNSTERDYWRNLV